MNFFERRGLFERLSAITNARHNFLSVQKRSNPLMISDSSYLPRADNQTFLWTEKSPWKRSLSLWSDQHKCSPNNTNIQLKGTVMGLTNKMIMKWKCYVRLSNFPTNSVRKQCIEVIRENLWMWILGLIWVKLHLLYYYRRNFCNLIGLEQWYFSLIWNTYMWKLQTFCG